MKNTWTVKLFLMLSCIILVLGLSCSNALLAEKTKMAEVSFSILSDTPRIQSDGSLIGYKTSGRFLTADTETVKVSAYRGSASGDLISNKDFAVSVATDGVVTATGNMQLPLNTPLFIEAKILRAEKTVSRAERTLTLKAGAAAYSGCWYRRL